MSGKQIKQPLTKEQGEKLIDTNLRQFGRLNIDIPASQIGEFDFDKFINMHSFPLYLEGRTGSELIADTPLPRLSNSTFRGYKRDGIVYRTSGRQFRRLDVFGGYIVWETPIETESNEEIIEFLDVNRVKVRQLGDREEEDCYVRRAAFGGDFFRKLKKNVTHVDQSIYISDWNFSSYDLVHNISYEELALTESTFFEYNDYIWAINRNGIFKVNVESSVPYCYKINCPPPTHLIDNVIYSDTRRHIYRYIYTNTRLIDGKYHGSRIGNKNDDNVPILKIEQESGTTRFDVTEGRDYGSTATTDPVGLGNETYGVLSGAVAGITNGIAGDIALWAAIATGTFTINMNGDGLQVCYCNFAGAQNLDDVRETIEDSIRVYWPSATVEIAYNAAGLSYWIIRTERVNGATITALGAAAIGIDISNEQAITGCGLRATAAVALDVDNNANYLDQNEVGDMEVASVKGYSPSLPQYHWTHFSVYRTQDIGAGILDNFTAEVNSAERYIWLQDIPIMKAFTCRSRGDNVLVCSRNEGLFSVHDASGRVWFENGTSSTIQFLCDGAGNQVYTPTSRYAMGDAGAVGRQSASIGAYETLTIRKRGNTVYRISGTRSFRAIDVRKPLFCADGDIVYITQFIDTDTVMVREQGDKNRMGAAMDPDERRFNDTFDDTVVRNRWEASGKSAYNYIASMRLWEELPESDVGTFVPGFFIVSQKNTMKADYSLTRLPYLIGSHNPEIHYDDSFEDTIQLMKKYPDRAVCICRDSIWVAPTNAPISEPIEEYGISQDRLPPFSRTDNTGCIYTGTYQEIDDGLAIMVTTEPAVRVFNGDRFLDQNLADSQVMKTLRQASVFTQSAYNPESGYIIWLALSTEMSSSIAANTLIDNLGYGTPGPYGTLLYKQDGQSSQLLENKINRYSGICIRFAVKPDQGQGWTEYENGAWWLWPEPRTKTRILYDDNGQPRRGVLDEVSGRWYEIGTRDGPSGAGITAIFLDKKSDYEGREIPCTVRWKEHIGAREQHKIKHIQTYLGIRPRYEDIRNASGHTDRGLRDLWEMALRIYRDGALTEIARTRDVPIESDGVYDRKAEAHRLQGELYTSTSEFRVVNYNPTYIDADRKAPRDKEMTESAWQREYALPVFRLSRGYEPALNRAKGTLCAVDFVDDTIRFGEGPDGKESAFQFALGDRLSDTIDPLTGDFTIQMGMRGVLPVTLIQIDPLIIRLIEMDGVPNLVYDDGNNMIIQPLNWDGREWVILKVSRHDRDLTISEDGVLLNTHLVNRIDYIGDVVLEPGEVVDIFDPYVLGSFISEDAFEYYYRDVIENHGDVVCPQWSASS